MDAPKNMRAVVDGRAHAVACTNGRAPRRRARLYKQADCTQTRIGRGRRTIAKQAARNHAPSHSRARGRVQLRVDACSMRGRVHAHLGKCKG
eukprot:4613980-Pleurochrysis_carterae.AAC.1